MIQGSEDFQQFIFGLSQALGDSGPLNTLSVRGVLPPHPLPLPWGEGETFSALESTERARTLSALATIPPLPKGEGRGEGEETCDFPSVQKVTSFLNP